MTDDKRNSTKITDTVNRFKWGTISKPEYIEEMYKLHHSRLFEYSEYISNSDIAGIEIYDSQILMTIRSSGAKFICPTGDYRVAPIEILNFSEYERAIGVVIKNLLRDDDIFFDVGANLGWYAVNIALSHPRVKIHCFDPIPQTFDFLNRNLEINGLSHVQTYNIGLSDAPGELEFFFYKEGSGNASSANLTQRLDVQRIVCGVDTIDEFTRRQNIRVDFIKCDVEGAELRVFKGGLRTIAHDKPIVFSEILRKWSRSHGYDPNDIFDLFRDLDYQAFTANGAGMEELRADRANVDFFPFQETKIYSGRLLQEFSRMDDETEQTNFFFLHKEKHKNLIEQFCED